MNITKGRKKKPLNLFIIGENGVGKSTLGENAPDPIFLGCEENDELKAHVADIPKTFKEFNTQLDEVRDKYKYKTLVIDTIDSLEQLRITELLGDKSQLNWDKQEDLKNDFILVRNKLKYLRDEKNMNIILLAHSKVRKKTDTFHQADYDTTEGTLRKSLMSVFGGWTSAVLFAAFKTEIMTNEQTEKNYVIGLGERVLFTEQRPGHPGKNRYGMPYEMEMKFSEIWKYYELFYAQGDSRSCDEITTNIMTIWATFEDPKLRKTIGDQVKKHSGNQAQLLKIEARAKERAQM